MIRKQTGFNMKKGFVVCVISLTLILCGCAKSITDRLGDTETILITFSTYAPSSAMLDTSLFAYYIIFSEQDPQLPNKRDYLTTPGRLYHPDRLDESGLSLEDYYSRYFSKWTNYIVIDETTSSLPRLFKGPFTAGNETTHYLYFYETKFAFDYKDYPQISLDFSKGSLDTTGHILYVTLVSVHRESGTIMDILEMNPINIQEENMDSGNGLIDDDISESANFRSWGLELY